jgi:RHS repeat-associated protein
MALFRRGLRNGRHGDRMTAPGKGSGVALAVALRSILAFGAMTSPATAQLAPVGDHYAARPSDSGHAGAVNSQGGFDVSVPLDLPVARGGLPVPLRIAYGGNRVGAAGVGWDVALSYVYVDTTAAHRRPMLLLDAPPRVRSRAVLVLDGERMELVRSATSPRTWLARRNGVQLELRDRGDGVMFLYDGEGRTYTFSSQGGAAGTRLVDGRLFLLNGVAASGGNRAVYTYQFGRPQLPGGGLPPSGNGLAIDLARVRYNSSPTTAGCFKHSVLFSYGLPAEAPLSISMLGSTPLVRLRTLAKVTVFSQPTCSQPDVPLRTYTFDYQADPDTLRPRLRSVRMSGRRGTPEEHVSLPVASYTYGAATGVDGKLTYRRTQRIELPDHGDLDGTFGIAWTREALPGGGEVATKQNLLDVDGDGRPDLVYRGGVSLNVPTPGGRTTFSPVGGWSTDMLRERAGLEIPRNPYHRIGWDPNLPDGSQPIPRHMVWQKVIDMNGDGRLDVIWADARDGLRPFPSWLVYLNTPDEEGPGRIRWQVRRIVIAPIQKHLREAGHEVDRISFGEQLPLEWSSTTRNSAYNQCWKWARDADGTLRWILSLDGYSGPPQNRCIGPQGQQTGRSDFDSVDGPDKTITEWELRDVNGDGYPDFVYNASPVGGPHPDSVENPPPSQPGAFIGQFRRTQKHVVRDLVGSRDIRALINVAGARLSQYAVSDEISIFSAPVTLEAGGPWPQGCGVRRWTGEFEPLHSGRTTQVCGFDDVNGDGIEDRLTSTVATEGPSPIVGKAALGTGDLAAPFSAGATVLWPGPLAVADVDLVPLDDDGHYKPSACPDVADPPSGNNPLGLPRHSYPIQRNAGLRDVTGDGIPDYVRGDGSTGESVWTVAVGTGTGFAPPRPVVSAVGLELSLERAGCFTEFAEGRDTMASGTSRGLYDLDGDGRPEVLALVDGAIEVYQLNAQPDPAHPFEGNVPAPPIEGRLTAIDNGYGAVTRIGYRSAKEDSTTAHGVPFAEVVVTSLDVTDALGTPMLATTQYAYGGATLVFDAAVDAFRFPGYRRRVELRLTHDRVIPPPTNGVATITDRYALEPFAPAMDANARFRRYLKTGAVRDVTTISGTVGADPWALLATDVDHDARRIAGTHRDWDTRLLPPGASDEESCLDLVFPYDYDASRDASLGIDQCAQRGLVVPTTELSWRGTPGTAPALTSDATVQTSSSANRVDELGRVTVATHFNDLFRSDDDVCVETAYATPVGGPQRVLSARASETTTNCLRTPEMKKILRREAWEYDTSPSGVKLPPGKVSKGFVTAHTVSRFDLTTGALLGEIRAFDATYDEASGALRTITRRRDDGAVQKQTWTYDPFALASVSERTDAISGSGAALPVLQTAIALDPVSLDVLGTTDPNGTQRGETFDGFGRLLLSTVTPPGGATGALSSTRYEGFAVGELGGRRVVDKTFTDPVPAAQAASAAGRTETAFFDPLGRELRTEIAMGADYGNQVLVVGYQAYDKLGRVRFAADPYLSTALTAYGTTYHFNTDGTPSCVIRGQWQQPLSRVTDETAELYPTCFDRFFAGHQEVVLVRDAASALVASPQHGMVEESRYSAIGRMLSRSTHSTDPPLERATFGYDALGNLTRMARHPDPLSDAAVATSWRYDSLGQVLELHEPDSAPQRRSYDNWGALTEVRWSDGTTDPATDRRTILRYDALGRVTHREDRTNGAVDPATVNDYAYDRPIQVATPPVRTTHVLGRLAKATFPTGSVAFGYDALGQVDQQVFTDTTVGPPVHYVQEHAYHGDGSLAALELRLPDTAFRTERVDYRYDSAGRIRSVDYVDGATRQSLFSATGSGDVDVLGRVRRARYGLATYTASYAETGRRLLEAMKVASPSGGSSREVEYPRLRGLRQAFDPVGRERARREWKDGVSAPPVVTSYDALGRLSASFLFDERSDALSLQRRFTYDPLGNILQHEDASSGAPTAAVRLSYQAVDRDRICSVGYGASAPPSRCNVRYDGAGNIVAQPTRAGHTRTSRYTTGGDVAEIGDGNGTRATFCYDAFGALQQLVLTGNTPDTRRDQHFGALIARRDENVGGTRTSVVTRSIAGPGVVATRHGATPTWTFAFGEARGNRFFTDETGAFVQDVDYQPYGEARSAGAQPGDPTYSSAQWNGGDALAALGVSQLGARAYDPVIGRFLSRDPLTIPRTAATTNPYAFAGNDPLNGSDPSGLDGLGGDEDVPACDGCIGSEIIRIDGGYWPVDMDPSPSAPGGGTFTYPEPTTNPVVPTLGRFTKYGKLAHWMHVADQMDRGNWDDPAVKIWTVDWTQEDFKRVESFQKWHARIEMAHGIASLPLLARGAVGLLRGATRFGSASSSGAGLLRGGQALPDTWASTHAAGRQWDCAAAVCARTMRVGRVKTADQVLKKAKLSQEAVNKAEGLTNSQIRKMLEANGKTLGPRVAAPLDKGDYLVTVKGGDHVWYGRRTARGEFYIEEVQNEARRYRGAELDAFLAQPGIAFYPITGPGKK